MQRVVVRQRGEIDGLRELVGRYERLSRKIDRTLTGIEERREGALQALIVTDRQREAALMAYHMLEWCSGIYDGRDELIEFISRTALTIDGKAVSGRTTGWTWTKHDANSNGMICGNLAYSISISYTPPGSEQTVWLSYRIRERHDPGVIRFLNIGTDVSRSYEPLPIRLESLPPHTRAEVAIITLRADRDKQPLFGHVKLHATADRVGAIHFVNSGISYSTWIAPPIKTWVNTTVPNPGSSSVFAPNGPPESMPWRAIVGEYVAPEATPE
ncbi:MAG: hypothetical protein LBR78_02345 [Holosporales bacterium]|jgi:hypothetical protein|nr:hypothetical protein [Holosporales bacterium]